MSRVHWIVLVCCSATALRPATMQGSALSAMVNADFVVNAATATCVESSGGGFGTINAPLTGCSETFGQSQFTSEGSANAAFGTLRVLGSVSYTNLTLPNGDFEFEWLLKAEANSQDTLTINQGSFLDVTIDVTGSRSNAGAFLFVDGATVPYNFPGVTTFRIPFKAGVPFAFNEDLRVDMEGQLTDNNVQGQSFAEFVDLSHTVQIVSTQVLDSQGNPISGATIDSQSGFDYGNPLGATSAVPEPGWTGLVLGGLALVGSRIRRFRRGNC